MPTQIQPQKPVGNQESVWDYPRPPRVEPTGKRLRVIYHGVVIAETANAQRVLETSHPPVYYIPPEDIRMEYMNATPRRTFCEFKGEASYWTIAVDDQTSEDAAWSYKEPNPAYEAIKDHVAFYASHVDECYVDDERVQAQSGDFYGGWITSDIVGPFKGGPGTWGW